MSGTEIDLGPGVSGGGGGGGGGSVTMGGDVTGASSGASVVAINGASVPTSGALTTGNLLQVSGAAALVYGALNLAGGAGYVTGTLPAGNQASQTMGGDVSGTTASATVAKINGSSVPVGGSLTTGAILQATGASALGYALLADANVSASAAISGSKVNPNFGSQTVTTTGNVSAGGATVSGSGAFRAPGGATTQLSCRNNANTADIILVKTDTSNNILLGDLTNSAQLTLYGQTAMSMVISGSGRYTFGTSALTMSVAGLTWDQAQSPAISQTAKTSDAAPSNMTIFAQGAYASATTFLTGATLTTGGGARTSTSGRRGGFRAALNGSSSEVMIECGEAQAEGTQLSRFVALCVNGTVSTTQLPAGTGDKVLFIGTCGTAPTANPTGGGLVYIASDGSCKYRSPAGTVTTMGAA